MRANQPANDRPPVLAARGLVKRYGADCILDGVSLSLSAGERVALMGPSGSGKTTLLNCLGGIDRPDSGTVEIDGLSLGSMDGNALARIRRKTVSSIFQFFHLLPTLTVYENVEFPLLLAGLSPGERQVRVAGLLREVNLTHRRGAFPETLSGGEQQRAAIARALAPRPAIILADEPTGNLDRSTGRRILELLASLTHEHTISLLLVTHSPNAARICQRVCHLKDGRLLEGQKHIEPV